MSTSQNDETSVVSPEDARTRQMARQADATERLADAVERQNDLLEVLVDAVSYGGCR